jgi:hypothetical protein
MRIVTKNLLVSLLLYLFAASASAFDLEKPPTPTDVESLAKQGWAASADQLSAVLADAYVPGKNGRAGSSGDPAFTSWIDLWRACELLSKSCDSQTAALVQRHFFKERSTGKLFFLGPGQTPLGTLDGAFHEAVRISACADAFDLDQFPVVGKCGEVVP